MSLSSSIPADSLAGLADADLQRQAARMAQDVFAGVFRQAVSGDEADDTARLADLGSRCSNWCRAAGSDDGRALRLALLISGLDQWGLAYTQAFDLEAIHSLTALIGGLRTRLDARDDMLFQRYFAQINEVEFAAIDFKVDLRRSIHLALWHAMAACETPEQVQGLVQVLGGMMVALDRQMPELGWRLLADALASIQMVMLSEHAPKSPLAQEGTQQLFAALRHALPAERHQAILALAGQAVLAWQQAARANGTGQAS